MEISTPFSEGGHNMSLCTSQRINSIFSDLFKLIPYEWDVYVFGSNTTGLACASSDVDLFVDQNNNYCKKLNRDEKVNNLRNLLYLFLTKNGILGCNFELFDVIYGARVPILRVIHVPTNTKVDISSANGLGVENSKLVRIYLDSDHRVKRMVVTILKWLRQTGLVGKGPYFRPYAVTWLVLFYLMRTSPPVVCPVVHLREDKLKKHNVAGWDCRFSSCLPETKNKQEYTQLFKKFLDFVISLDFENYVICPLTGDFIPRATFKTPELLPPCFSPYQENMKDCKLVYGLRLDTTICLQDPLELVHNITKLVDASVVTSLVRICELHKQKLGP